MRTERKLGALMLLIVIIVAVVLAGLRVVPEGNTGVKIRGGKAVGQLSPGWHIVTPIYEDVVTLSFRTETYTMSSTKPSQVIERNARVQDKISVKTTEGLNVNMDITIRYRMKKDQAQEIFTQLGNTDDILEKLVRPTAREEIRTAGSQYDVTTIYSENRSDFRQTVFELVQDDFQEYGFVLEKVQIRNIMLPKEVEAAVQRKEQVTQEIGAKRKEIEKEKLEKQRKIVEAEGTAKQNEILDRSLTEEVLVNRYIKALRSGDVKIAYIPIGESGTPQFVENLNSGQGSSFDNQTISSK